MREGALRGGLDILRHIGPGLLVTVGFIDPGNWASNFAAGSQFGYALLWVVTLSTIMLIVLQHNVAHLGIVTGLCLSEATTRYLPQWVSRPVLWSAMGASVSTSLAEILGAAIALQMLFGLPLIVGGRHSRAHLRRAAIHQFVQTGGAWYHSLCIAHRFLVFVRTYPDRHTLGPSG